MLLLLLLLLLAAGPWPLSVYGSVAKYKPATAANMQNSSSLSQISYVHSVKLPSYTFPIRSATMTTTTISTTLFATFCQRKAMYDTQLASVKAAAWEEKEHLLILIGYVLMNMTLTLALWHFVYDMEASPLFIFFDLETQYSTGNAFLDAIVNGLIVSLIVTILSLLLAACIMRKMKQFVTGFIRWNILIANHLIPIQLLSDLHAKLQLESNVANGLFFLVAMCYLVSLFVAFNTDRLPTAVRQLFNVCFCSTVSVYYLRVCPRYTIWAWLIGQIIWDSFNVEWGPIKTAMAHAGDYNEGLLRMVMFSTGGKQQSEEDEESTTASTFSGSETAATAMTSSESGVRVPSSSSSSSSSFASTDDLTTGSTTTGSSVGDSGCFIGYGCTCETDESSCSSSSSSYSYTGTTTYTNSSSIEENAGLVANNAYEALSDESLWIGMGDMVIYSLLIGKAAATGPPLAVLACMFGIVTGIVLTLGHALVKANEDDDVASIPALPRPLMYGMALFALVASNKPTLQWLVA